jgi:2-polyprenyl-3-methyl-5-hydroxy-6-metoxy-1,4-benzoquinol methylase
MAMANQRASCNQCKTDDNSLLFSKKGYDLVACKSCGLAYISNPPDQEALQKVYSAEANYHNFLLDVKSPQFAEMQAIARTHMGHVADWAEPGRLLDAGCSTGLFLDLARARGFNVSGVEFSKESANFARDHFGLSVDDGDIQAVDKAGGQFDVITMFDVIEHVPDPLADMRAIHDLLKPGGLFVVSTPNIDGLFPRLSLPFAKMVDHWPHAEPPHHLFQFSIKTLGKMLETAGFAVEAVRHEGMALSYSFGQLPSLMRSPKALIYAALFAPLAKLGPYVGQGDWIYVAARKAAV